MSLPHSELIGKRIIDVRIVEEALGYHKKLLVIETEDDRGYVSGVVYGYPYTFVNTTQIFKYSDLDQKCYYCGFNSYRTTQVEPRIFACNDCIKDL